MKLVPCQMPGDCKAYIQFMKSVYRNDPHYVDYVTPVAVEVFSGKSPFSRLTQWQAFWLMSENQKVGVVTFLIHQAYSHVLQLAFMEYTETPGLAAFIAQEAIAYGRSRGVKRLVCGLNGHVNYGLGLSLSETGRPTFGAPYSKRYYSRDFKALGFDEKTLSAYSYPWGDKSFPISPEKMDRLTKKITFRAMTAKTFEADLVTYTDLNNRCFKDHDFYYPRTDAEDRSLFMDLKYFMSKGSLIFAERNGNPIGFLLWYPDWSQVMQRGETLSLWTFIKSRLMQPFIKRFKLVEWAVLPEYRRKGVPIGLLYACYQQVSKKAYTTCLTSWILDENKDSNGFGHKWGKPKERYAVYSLSLEGSPNE